MSGLLATTSGKVPEIDWVAIAPLLAVVVGTVVTLLVGLARSRVARATVVPGLTVLTLVITIALCVAEWGQTPRAALAGTLMIDDLTLALTVLFALGGIGATLLGVGSLAAEDVGHGEFHALLLASIAGMFVLVAAQDMIVLFLGLELLSMPLYVLCAGELRRARSLESGLKYLIVGSVGSAVLLYGLALVYGATGTTNYAEINAALVETGFSSDVLLLTGAGFVLVGLAFKASVAPFHQWTPDVYQGAPTAITGFMAVATKAAAFGVLLRFFDVALISSASVWAPALAVLAAISIVVGNVGALGQRSVKRILAYSSIAQAGYILAGVVVTTQIGIAAVVFYLAAYVLMNVAAFAVIAARERELGQGDTLEAFRGLGRQRPVLGWSMSIAMLALAGFPATAGFFGKIYLIGAAVDNGYGWLAAFIAIGSAVSLAYYLRVVAAVWTEPADAPTPAPAMTPGGEPVIAGGSADAADEPLVVLADDSARPSSFLQATAVAAVCTVATVAIGLYPEPLLELAQEAAAALGASIR